MIYPEIRAKGSGRVASQRKGCFWCVTNRLWKKSYLSTVCFGEERELKSSFFGRTADDHCHLPTKEHHRRADKIKLVQLSTQENSLRPVQGRDQL